MKRLFRFNREEDDFGTRRWYIDLPEWEGSKADLEMVSGADIMLDVLNGNTHYVDCVVSNEDMIRPDLMLVTWGDKIDDGYYIINEYLKELESLGSMEIWLCEVTKFVFGGYPTHIYIKVV